MIWIKERRRSALCRESWRGKVSLVWSSSDCLTDALWGPRLCPGLSLLSLLWNLNAGVRSSCRRGRAERTRLVKCWGVEREERNKRRISRCLTTYTAFWKTKRRLRQLCPRISDSGTLAVQENHRRSWKACLSVSCREVENCSDGRDTRKSSL